jgi:hypothetical protein
LPPNLKEIWKKSGLIDASEHKEARFSLGINQLKLPDTIAANLQEDSVAEATFTDFLENCRLLEEIRKDVVRTHPDLHFFLEPNHNLGLRRYAAMERILFVWARLNQGVSSFTNTVAAGTFRLVCTSSHSIMIITILLPGPICTRNE